MSRIGALFDRVWRWWTFLFGIVGLAGVCFIVSVCVTQSQKDKIFVRTNLLPLARFVGTFQIVAG